MGKTTFQTEDGVKIVGDFEKAGEKVAILLHMLPAVRGSWSEFSKKLNSAGYSTLAIDLRGHGESTQGPAGKMLDYKKFSDLRHQESIKDIEAAYLWLEREYGTAPEDVIVIGASIGANLALRYLAENSGVQSALLLSPGLDYHGVMTEEFAEKVRPEQAIFYIAAKDDEYSEMTVKKLYDLTDCRKELKLYKTGGHGTNLFNSHPELMDEIIAWLRNQS